MRPCFQAPTIDPDPALDLRESTERLSSEELDVEILSTLLFIDDRDLPGPTSRAFVTQLRLISSFAEMTPYTTIRSLINDGFSRVMMIRQITVDAVRFVKLEKLIQQHTEKKFQYLKILKLEGHNLLTQQSFPHLFRTALLFKRKCEGTFKDYRTTRELNGEVSEQEIEEALQEPPFKKIKLAQLDHEGLKTIYGMSNAVLTQLLTQL